MFIEAEWLHAYFKVFIISENTHKSQVILQMCCKQCSQLQKTFTDVSVYKLILVFKLQKIFTNANSVYKHILKCSQVQKMFTNVKLILVLTTSENVHKCQTCLKNYPKVFTMFTNLSQSVHNVQIVHKYQMFINSFQTVFTMSENVHKCQNDSLINLSITLITI